MEYYSLRGIKARKKETEILYIFFGGGLTWYGRRVESEFL